MTFLILIWKGTKYFKRKIKYDEIQNDGIAEAFIEFAKYENFSFWNEE